MSAEQSAPCAFVSYAQDPQEHKDQVAEFCELLVANGVKVVLDQWDDDGRKDWSAWALEGMDYQFVLVIASRAYLDRVEGRTPQNVGRGAQFEAAFLRDRLTMDRAGWTRRILPVVLPGHALTDVPAFLTPYSTTRYRIGSIDATDENFVYLLSHLHGTALTPSPQLGEYAGVPLAKVIAPDRDSLAPQTLDPVVRAHLLDAAAARQAERTRVGDRRQALALVGEGGIGKSVLLGQLLDRIERADTGGVVLVSAASVIFGSAGDVRSIDEALGTAAHRTFGQSGLIALLRAVSAAHGHVTLLLDTLDLLLDHHRAAPLALVIAEALEIGDVVFTCRTQEFGSYLSGAPRLAGRVTEYPLPLLTSAEIVEWARDHLAAQEGEPADHDAFLTSLEGGIAGTGSLRHVCALPVRLALTCRAFGRLGRVPPDLTVTGLYDAYWSARVRTYAGMTATPEGDSKERAALDVAARIIAEDVSIRLRVPQALLTEDALPGLRMLVSEGVLRDVGASWEFFHQTFAEYAHGRWLLRFGAGSDQVNGFLALLGAGHTNLWPLARTLLLQTADFHDYGMLESLLPKDSDDSTKTRVLGAVQRLETEILPALLTEIAGKPESLRVALPVLNDVPPRHRQVVFEAAVKALRDHPAELGDHAMGTLVSAMPLTPAAFKHVMNTLWELEGQLDPKRWDRYVERVIQPFAAGPSPGEIITDLCANYRRLKPLGRRATVRAHMAAALSDDRVADLAVAALGTKCPPLPEDELIALMELFWASPAVRTARGWSDWRDLLAMVLGADWEHGQLMIVLGMALRDEDVAGQVIGDVLAGAASKRHVQVLSKFAVLRPDWFAGRLMSLAPLSELIALTPICKCIRKISPLIDRETQIGLVRWLAPGKQVAPRAVWPALAALAANDLKAHRELLDEISDLPDLPVHVRSAMVEAWSAAMSRPVVDALLDQLRVVVGGDKRHRASLEARIADTDLAARAWVAERVLRDPSLNLARDIVKTIVAHHSHNTTSDFAMWVCGLLSTPHTHATELLAGFLETIDPSPLPAEAAGLVIARMRVAAAKSESSSVSRTLLRLLIRIDGTRPLDPGTVLTVFEVVRSRLPADLRALSAERIDDHSAAFRDLTMLSGTLMSQRLPGRQVRDLLTGVLRELDPDHLGTSMARTVEALVRSVAGRDPDALDWLEDVFGLPDISLGVQLVIAKIFLVLDPDRAVRLRNRPGCPPEVIALVVTRSD